jgi:hypothetical protein
MKKLLVVVLAFCLTISVFASGKGEAASAAPASQSAGPSLKAVKIAVAFWQIDANSILIQKYLQEYVSPSLNVSFMFSEAIDNSDKLMTFMENAYAAGCQGIMNYQGTTVEQAISKANELGLYIANQTTNAAENKDSQYNMGFVSATADGVAKDFGDLVTNLVSDGKTHSVIIVSAGAAFGNQEHYESTVNILNTLQKVYGLTYTKAVPELARSRAETQVENDKGIKITIYPGYPTGNTYVTGMSTILQTGEYDTMLACNAAYAQFSVAVDEVEKAYKKDIRVSAITSITDQTKTAFNTLDSTGHNSLNSALLMPSISQASGLFALVYNGITGFGDKLRRNGETIYYNSPKWKCNSADEYRRIEQINSSPDKYEVTLDELKKMLGVFNSGISADGIYSQLEGVTSEYLLKARGL